MIKNLLQHSMNKEAFIKKAKQMLYVHHFFTVNISDKMDKIIFVFRKKGIFDSPIIASATISSKEFQLSKQSNTEMKTFNIYEPLQNGHKTRRVYGEMQVQFSITTAFPTFKTKEPVSKGQKISKHNGYSKINIENEKYNSLLIDDTYN